MATGYGLRTVKVDYYYYYYYLIQGYAAFGRLLYGDSEEARDIARELRVLQVRCKRVAVSWCRHTFLTCACLCPAAAWGAGLAQNDVACRPSTLPVGQGCAVLEIRMLLMSRSYLAAERLMVSWRGNMRRCPRSCSTAAARKWAATWAPAGGTSSGRS